MTGEIMKVTLTDHTMNPAFRIGDAAWVCYDAKRDNESNIKRAISCKKRGHLATLRFAYATFHISGISRACSHQLVRVAHAGILQKSQRYVEESSIGWVVPPSVESLPLGVANEMIEHLTNSSNLYKKLRDNGVKREDARYFLPQACTTELEIIMNFQGWSDFLRNRTAPAAQWEIRGVANEIERLLHSIAPEIF